MLSGVVQEAFNLGGFHGIVMGKNMKNCNDGRDGKMDGWYCIRAYGT